MKVRGKQAFFGGKGWGLLVLMILALAVAGCGDKSYKPVAIKENVDKCATCQMLIKDDEHATQIILKDGKPLKFDDLGDLYVWLNKNGRGDVGAMYVRDFKTKDWLELEKAYYVYDAGIKTPMSYGVISFRSESDADAYIKEKGMGAKLTAKDLDTREWSNGMMMKMK